MVCEKIETKDLILGKAKQEDLENIYNNYWCSEKSAKYMLWVPQKNLQEAQDRLDRTINYQKDHFAFMVYEKKSGMAIGQAAMFELQDEPGVWEDAGIGIGEKFVGKGYGKQILSGMIDYLFEHENATKIICSCHTDNIPSAKMQQSCGLVYFKSVPYTREKDNLTYQSDNYMITREMWLERQCNKN